MTEMTIGRLAAAAGVGVETVRYYQRRGLLGQPARTGLRDGVRRYGERDVQQLRFIRAAQGAGFTLDQIGALLDLDATDDRARARALAAEQIAALDAKIAALVTARDALVRLARDCATGGSGPCPILTAFDSA
ncbi:MAG: MerR family transcriptional regulator [Sphingomonas bacterium]|uniref:MerR family transcriptional regulator n=1 Tax=Sphingomonas bacterium TaxID=1895847 RepID=UPI0026241383|nr:MerR family transcriptional regulator [Sphingomonas bacterium]MDB5709515.1 MerR family transcriptional regulator [Sphingomonas bacterium]